MPCKNYTSHKTPHSFHPVHPILSITDTMYLTLFHPSILATVFCTFLNYSKNIGRYEMQSSLNLHGCVKVRRYRVYSWIKLLAQFSCVNENCSFCLFIIYTVHLLAFGFYSGLRIYLVFSHSRGEKGRDIIKNSLKS